MGRTLVDYGYDNGAVVPVPAQSIDDDPLTIIIDQCGVTPDGAAQYSYGVVYQNKVGIAGNDLYGPAHGIWPEARDMARTLASFLGSTFEGSQVTEHGREYTEEEQVFLEVHAERLSIWACGE